MKAASATAIYIASVALTISTLAGCGKGGGSSPDDSTSTGHAGEGGSGVEGSGGSGNTGSGGTTGGSAAGGTSGGSSGGASGGGASGGGTSGGGTGGGGASVDLETYCDEISERYFDWLASCYGTMAYPESYRMEFTSRGRERCLAVALGVEAGRLGFDGARAHACLEAIDTENCDGFQFIGRIDECRALFTPLVEQGEDCYADATTYFSITGATSECRDGYCDTADRQTCPGTCEALKSDETECFVTAECQPESYCDSGECKSRVGLDAPCDGGEACLADLVCTWAADAETGTCRAPSEPGAACSESEPCVGGYFCTAGECQSKVGTGEECFQHHHCWNDELCVDRDVDGPDPKTCGGPGVEGDACGNSIDCQAALFCDISGGQPGLCTPRLTVGEECSSGGTCEAAAYCNLEVGECQEVGEEGDSCLMFGIPGQDDACAEGLGCMSNGECHPATGEPGAWCRTTNESSCNSGLFCSRETFVCEPAAAEGDFCNPFWYSGCEGDLACICSGDDCVYGADANVHDTLHTCQPRRAVGESCFHDYECPIDGYCQYDEDDRSCVVSSLCLPEPG